MKISFVKSDLLRSINTVMRAVPVRTTMPVLECILIDASSDEVTLTANDLEMGIETKTNAQIIQRGIIAIDARILSDIVRKLPDSEITIESDSKFNVVISCGKSVFNIAGKDGAEFTRLPDIEKNVSVSLSQLTLKDMILQTIFSIAQNESNIIMTGESLEITGNTMKLISLDGHRVSLRKTELTGNTKDIKVIVPGKTLSDISKIISGNADDQVNVYFTGNHVLFEFDETLVVSRLIDGKFFSIDRMISGDYDTRMTVNRKELVECIERATLLVREDDKKPIVFNVVDGSMEVSIRSQLGSFNDVIPVDKEGKDIQIGFNPKFLLDSLRCISDEEVQIDFTNSKAPCFIRKEDSEYIYLILPVNYIS